MKLIAANVRITGSMQKRVVIIAKGSKGWYRAVDEDGHFRTAPTDALKFVGFLEDAAAAEGWLEWGTK